MAVTSNDNKFTTITLPVSQTQSTDFAKVFKKYIFHWPIFFLSLAVFIVLAFFYLKYTKAVFPINATLEFKDSKNAEYNRQDKDNINQLDQISTPIVFENEIEVLKSKRTMLQVVKDMNLWIGYSKGEDMVTTDLYKSSPVKFQFIKMPAKIDQKGIKLKIILNDANSFSIEDKDGGKTSFKYGQNIQSNFGLWKLDPTALINEYIGSKLSITIGDPSDVADYYVSNLKSTLEDKEVPFVHLSMTDVVPQRGVDVLNAVIGTYLKGAIDEKNKKTEATIKFISKRIDSIGKDLHLSEAQIQSYASAQGITDINTQSQVSVQDANASQKALDDITLQIRIINNIETYINSPGSNKQPSTVGLQDGSLNTMLDKLTEVELNKQHLLANNPPDNPVFEPINNEISTLQANIREKIRNDKETLLLTKSQLQSTNSRAESQIRSVPGQEIQYGGMKRDKEVEEELYVFLMKQREQLSLKFASTVSDAKVVDYAHAGDAKWPKGGIVYFLAAFIGMFVPIGIIYTRNSFDNKITHRRQIEQEVDIPILGELSFQESSTAIVITKERGSFAIGEQFRALRSKLYQVLNNDENGRVGLITSSTSGEGKSFVSANLAVTLAYASRKTIILEMDLRKPKISSIFELSEEHPGISDYLESDHLKIDDLIRSSGISGLDVMGAGTIQNNPSELLEKVNLDNLIDILRKKYDFVIIDSPPIHLVTDALIIARVVDAALYVIRQGYTLKEELDFINEVKSENRFPKLNLIFNGIKREKYGYGYNYNNSYYNTYTSRPKNTVGHVVRNLFSRF